MPPQRVTYKVKERETQSSASGSKGSRAKKRSSGALGTNKGVKGTPALDVTIPKELLKILIGESYPRPKKDPIPVVGFRQ